MVKVIKAISLWQPWAGLIFVPDPAWRKEHETRHWAPPSNIDGFVIHAAKRFTRDQQELAAEEPFRHAIELLGNQLSFGSYIGYVDLKGVEKTEVVRQRIADRPDFDFGDYTAGRYAWELANPVAFHEAVPGRGYQGIWDPPGEVMAILEQLGVIA